MPDMHDLKGGSEWANNGKSIIIIHREFGSTVTDIKINKAKPKIVGVQGVTALMYDIKQGAFYESKDGRKVFAEPKKVIQQYKPKELTRSNDFEI